MNQNNDKKKMMDPQIAADFMRTSVGRNDKCPCGSGKKVKYCCGKSRPAPVDPPPADPNARIRPGETITFERIRLGNKVQIRNLAFRVIEKDEKQHRLQLQEIGFEPEDAA